METRSCIMVLGMHRSGTSALTRLIHDMGFALPSAPLDAHLTDNAEGYWEAESVVRLNNRLLDTLNLDWKSIKPLHETDLFSEATTGIRSEISDYLRSVYAQKTHIVIKDPRMCRLLPVWKAELEKLDVETSVILLSRPADQVRRSLEQRAAIPEIASAAITDKSHAHLLWLRYTLEAERHSRHLPRYTLSYEDLIENPQGKIEDIARHLEHTLTFPVTPADSGSIQQRELSPLPEPGNDIERLCASLHVVVTQHLPENRYNDWLDRLYETSLAPIPDIHQHKCPELPAGLLTDLCIRHITGPIPQIPDSSLEIHAHISSRPENLRPVIFISDNPQTRSHIYRVKNPVDALNRRGVPAFWNISKAFSQHTEFLKAAGRVIIHRSEWNEDIQACINACKENGVPVACDFDDLVFDEQIVDQGYIHFINQLPEQDRHDWLQKIRRYRKTLDACDSLFCSTDTIARHAATLGYSVQVIANGFSRENLELARFFRQHEQQIKGGEKRIGYASGTDTHGADFATITEPLIDWLNGHPDWTLTVIGQLNTDSFGGSLPASQLEIRPLVEPVNLAFELTRLSINLIPLELNPFCNAKSPLKWYEAALCGVPTIASNNPMYTELFSNDTRGLTAFQDGWQIQLDRLASDHEIYSLIQQNAFKYCSAYLNADRLAEGYL